MRFLFTSAEFPVILSSALDVLDGTVTAEGLANIATQCDTTAEEIDIAVKAAGGLIWEFVKSNSLSSLSPVLQQVGFEASLAEAFGKCVAMNKFRLSNLKKTLAISSMRYLDMEWRLDIELARRNAICTNVNPKFMMRLDFTNQDHSSVDINAQLNATAGSATSVVSGKSSIRSVAPTDIDSLHLEASYANMKNLQRELETALEQMNGLHCQRFAKYIS